MYGHSSFSLTVKFIEFSFINEIFYINLFIYLFGCIYIYMYIMEQNKANGKKIREMVPCGGGWIQGNMEYKKV